MKMTFLVAAVVGMLSVGGCMPTTPSAEENISTTPGTTAEDATPRETIGKTTQNVLDLTAALADGGVLASTKVKASDPLSASAGAYRTTVGKLGVMSVEQSINIRDAQSIQDPKPLDHTTLMAEIIKPEKPDGIQLPMLPYYQEYAWDEPNQKLVVVDFPARQAEREKQR